MSTSGRIHGEFLRLLFFLSNKQVDDYFAALGYEAHKEEFCHRSCVFFYRNWCTIGLACAQTVALRGAPTTARRHDDRPFIVLTETKFSFRCIPVGIGTLLTGLGSKKRTHVIMFSP
jgi:hypothetical protein